MSVGSLAAALVLLWTTEALLLARWMARRGHDVVTWMLLGMLMGPLAVGIALIASTEAGLRARPSVLSGLGSRQGPIDLLVGLDGSPQSEVALAAALRLFEPRLGRLALVTVLDLDRGDDPGARQLAQHLTLSPALDRLEPLARAGVRITSTVVAGRASQELVRLASEGGYDAVGVGARGHGFSELLVGSTVEELLHASRVPVIFGPAPSAAPPPRLLSSQRLDVVARNLTRTEKADGLPAAPSPRSTHRGRMGVPIAFTGSIAAAVHSNGLLRPLAKVRPRDPDQRW